MAVKANLTRLRPPLRPRLQARRPRLRAQKVLLLLQEMRVNGSTITITGVAFTDLHPLRGTWTSPRVRRSGPTKAYLSTVIATTSSLHRAQLVKTLQLALQGTCQSRKPVTCGTMRNLRKGQSVGDIARRCSGRPPRSSVAVSIQSHSGECSWSADTAAIQCQTWEVDMRKM